LGAGLVEGEWSEIGMDLQIDEATLTAAGNMAFSTLQTLAADLKIDMVALYNFNQFSRLPGDAFKKYNRVQFRSCAQLPINFDSMEEYLSHLSGAARKDLHRKMRVTSEVRVIRSRTISPFLDRIYMLYQKTVERSPINLCAHNRLFFEKICERVPGAEYTLYFVREELAAFNLLTIKQQRMVDLYFCMDFDLGRKYNLYVLSWLENVRICVERKIPLYFAGQGTEKTKAHLGATFISSFILYKHRHRMFDRLLVRQSAVINTALSHLGFWPAVAPDARDVPGNGGQERVHVSDPDQTARANDRSRGERFRRMKKA
jgi:predicted N-acyltransferase